MSGYELKSRTLTYSDMCAKKCRLRIGHSSGKWASFKYIHRVLKFFNGLPSNKNIRIPKEEKKWGTPPTPPKKKKSRGWMDKRVKT